MITAAKAPVPADVSGTQPVVSLRDVFCVHRTSQGDAAALQGASLDVDPGELLCVLGPSGAGKSTLLRVIAGLQIPSAGMVRVLGSDIGRLPARDRARFRHQAIGLLPQHADALLVPELPVIDSVARPLALRGSARDVQRLRAREMLAAVGLSERTGALPRELSGGERQRIALCVALAHRPALLLADEPTGELDAAAAYKVRQLLDELARGSGTTVILVSHDPASADIADRSVLLRDGRVVRDDRGGLDTLLVSGGWVHLPGDLLDAAGIGGRARAYLSPDGVVISGAPEPEDANPPPEVDPTQKSSPEWEPARVELQAVDRARGPRRVLAELSRRLPAGGLIVVSGPSGCGKTTLLRLLAGLDQPDGGTVWIDSRALNQCDEEQRAELRRRRIGYLPQEPWPIDFLSAQENVTIALSLRGFTPEAAAQRAAVVLARVGLSDRARQRVSRLSAGETARVALARALASARGLLLVDEPTSRLDRAAASAMAEVLAQTAREDRQTVICASHDIELITRADEVIALERLGDGG
jgi:ABC-type lipoprotein export system ATPase subunit